MQLFLSNLQPMRKTIACVWIIIILFNSLLSAAQNNSIPHLEKNKNAVRLVVQDKPFLIRGGELGNSSASANEYMLPVWPKLKNMQLNTVLMPVYWELIEPEENKFDFTLLDSLITNARTHDLHLVLLWFGTWKNSMSCYVPQWMKTNTKRFECTVNKNGRKMEIITAFSKAALEADKKAFATLMDHIKTIDAVNQTVIMVQVENEVGMLSTAKETTPAALKLFNQEVPKELMKHLQKNRDDLVPEFREKWQQQDFRTSGTWQQVFGEGLSTDEIFQAYYYASYVNEVARAGKEKYNLPMYVNAALNRPGVLPGNYPSAGPLPQVMDIWKFAAPAIDMLSPDFYNPDTKYWCGLYTRSSNTLFIPEMRFDSTCGAKALYVTGHYKALGFSPFSVENVDGKPADNLQKSFGVLQQLSSYILQQNNIIKMDGVLLDKTHSVDTLTFGKYIFKISHDNTLGWNGHKQDAVWDATGAIIIQTGDDDFIIGGTGIVINFFCTDTTVNAGIASDEKGRFDNDIWKTILVLNGDQTHQGRHVRIEPGDWDIQRFKLYQY
jgi:beta-galactosidase GanA